MKLLYFCRKLTFLAQCGREEDQLTLLYTWESEGVFPGEGDLRMIKERQVETSRKIAAGSLLNIN
jgi:hypothetical protein